MKKRSRGYRSKGKNVEHVLSVQTPDIFELKKALFLFSLLLSWYSSILIFLFCLVFSKREESIFEFVYNIRQIGIERWKIDFIKIKKFVSIFNLTKLNLFIFEKI